MQMLLVLALLSYVLAVTTGSYVVETHCGEVEGHLKDIDPNIIEYLGIPFAKNTAGKRRWTKPEYLEKSDHSCWNNTFKADKFGPMCPQRGGYDEDCLSINIWTPVISSTVLRPVMVFIPGGGLVEEGSHIYGYEPFHVARSGQVSVSFNYRVGIFGFMALKSLSERDSGDENSPSGNWGFMDQLLALHWVQRNIKHFGGDPDQVTIFGHSSGGSSVFCLLASPLIVYKEKGEERRLFHRAISMSGSNVFNTPLKQSQQENEALVERTQCKRLKGKEQLACLQQISAEELVNVTLRQSYLYPYYNNFTFCQGLPLPYEHQPGIGIVDGYVLKEPVFDALARTKSQASDIPIVVGTMRQEIECLTQLPLDLIANFTCAQYMTFLRNWPGTVSKIADKLNDLYPCETMGAYKAIVTLASDIRAVCSNIHMAHVLAKSNSSRTLYFYNSPHHLLNYYYKYAFHSLDISMMLYNYDDMKKWMVPADYQYAELLFESLTTFAKEGVMAKGSFWRQFGTKERYYTNVLEIPPSVVENFNQEACDYLSSVGFDTSWWTGE